MSDSSTDTLSIGQVARKASVSVETVRYYERERLIAEPPRAQSGYRRYPTDVVKRIRFIRRAKGLGFTCADVSCSRCGCAERAPAPTCGPWALEKIDDIEDTICGLQRMHRALTELTAACNGKGPTHDCPILEALEDEGDEREG